MEKVSKTPAEKGSDDSKPNFYDISQKRKGLRKAVNELGINDSSKKDDLKTSQDVIFDKHYQQPLVELNQDASAFKIEDYGGVKGAVNF